MTIELSEYVIDAIADAIVKKMQVPTEEEKALLQKWHDNRGISMKDFEDAMDALEQEPCREADDYENEIEDLHNRLDIAEYDKERLREEVTNLEEKIKALEHEPVLDKIRADVINIADGKQGIKARSVLQIIDKYRAERSDKE